MSRTGTNIVRFAVAALLGLAACLVAWWPQSAAGSGDTVAVSSPAAAAPTQKTPTRDQPPDGDRGATTAAPPPAPTPARHPQADQEADQEADPQPTTLHNNGGPTAARNGGNNGGSGSSSTTTRRPTQSSTVSDQHALRPAGRAEHAVAPTKKPSPSSADRGADHRCADHRGPARRRHAAAGKDDKVKDDAETYDTYLTSSEPVATKSAPVWVVPGILLVLTSMLALLGGVLGRGTRLAPVRASDEPRRARDPTSPSSTGSVREISR